MSRKALIATAIVVSAVAAVLLATSAQASHHKTRRHPARPPAHAMRPKPNPQPAVDPLYESCESPWKHPGISCPGAGSDGG